MSLRHPRKLTTAGDIDGGKLTAGRGYLTSGVGFKVGGSGVGVKGGLSENERGVCGVIWVWELVNMEAKEAAICPASRLSSG